MSGHRWNDGNWIAVTIPKCIQICCILILPISFDIIPDYMQYDHQNSHAVLSLYSHNIPSTFPWCSRHIPIIFPWFSHSSWEFPAMTRTGAFWSVHWLALRPTPGYTGLWGGATHPTGGACVSYTLHHTICYVLLPIKHLYSSHILVTVKISYAIHTCKPCTYTLSTWYLYNTPPIPLYNTPPIPQGGAWSIAPRASDTLSSPHPSHRGLGCVNYILHRASYIGPWPCHGGWEGGCWPGQYIYIFYIIYCIYINYMYICIKTYCVNVVNATRNQIYIYLWISFCSVVMPMIKPNLGMAEGTRIKPHRTSSKC